MSPSRALALGLKRLDWYASFEINTSWPDFSATFAFEGFPVIAAFFLDDLTLLYVDGRQTPFLLWASPGCDAGSPQDVPLDEFSSSIFP